VAFLNLTFVRRDCGIWDTNVKFTPLATDEEALIGMVFGIYSRHGLQMLANFLVNQMI
jgi:hypothetical protein